MLRGCLRLFAVSAMARTPARPGPGPAKPKKYNEPFAVSAMARTPAGQTEKYNEPFAVSATTRTPAPPWSWPLPGQTEKM